MAASGVPSEIVFHAKVRTGHRIAIPQAERAASGIRPGDLVSVTLRKVQTPQEGPR